MKHFHSSSQLEMQSQNLRDVAKKIATSQEALGGGKSQRQTPKNLDEYIQNHNTQKDHITLRQEKIMNEIRARKSSISPGRSAKS